MRLPAVVPSILGETLMQGSEKKRYWGAVGGFLWTLDTSGIDGDTHRVVPPLLVVAGRRAACS